MLWAYMRAHSIAMKTINDPAEVSQLFPDVLRQLNAAVMEWRKEDSDVAVPLLLFMHMLYSQAAKGRPLAAGMYAVNIVS